MKKKLLLFTFLISAFTQANAQDPGPTPGNTGSVTFTYRGSQVTLTTVRAADNMIWLQQNLGASQVATSATDNLSYGDLFQWGRWDDGHQLRTSANQQVPTLTVNNPSGIAGGNINFLRNNVQPTWWGGTASSTPPGNPALSDTWSDGGPTATNGTDPCTALGLGWRLPTQAEWAAVKAAESITNLATGYTSNLKLPSSGHRNGANGGVQQPGFANLFWSSTNATAQNPYSFYNGSVSNIWPRAYGASCRCVKVVVPCNGMPTGGTIDASDTSICPNAPLSLMLANASSESGVEYQWQSRPAGGIFTDIAGATTTAFASTSQTTGLDYRCKVTCTNTSDSTFSDTVSVHIIALPVNLGNDTTLCAGNTIVLDAGISGDIYSWSNGTAQQTLDISSAGQYWVRVSNTDGCSGNDTINIQFITAPVVDSILITPGTGNREYAFSVVNALYASDYEWLFGDNGTSTQPAPGHTYGADGDYNVSVRLSNECGDTTITKTLHVTGVTSVTENKYSAPSIHLYPNPAKESFNIRFDGNSSTGSVKVFTVTGREIYSAAKVPGTISTRGWKSGLYIIKISTAFSQALLKLSILE